MSTGAPCDGALVCKRKPDVSLSAVAWEEWDAGHSEAGGGGSEVAAVKAQNCLVSLELEFPAPFALLICAHSRTTQPFLKSQLMHSLF